MEVMTTTTTMTRLSARVKDKEDVKEGDYTTVTKAVDLEMVASAMLCRTRPNT